MVGGTQRGRGSRTGTGCPVGPSGRNGVEQEDDSCNALGLVGEQGAQLEGPHCAVSTEAPLELGQLPVLE